MLNRIKFGVFLLLVVGLTIWSTRGRSIAATTRAIGVADARLLSAVGQFDVGLKLIESRAAAVAGLAALDQGLIQALRPSPPKRAGKSKGKRVPPPVGADDAADDAARERATEAAARRAVAAAEKALGFELPQLSFFAAADRGGIARKLKAGVDGPQKEAVAFLADAARGRPRRGFARVNDGLWYGVGIPTGEGGALVLFVPLDEAWARSLKSSAGVDVALSVGLPKAVTTVPPAEAKPIVDAALKRAGVIADAGRLGRIDAGFDLPAKVPPVPLLFARAPAVRTQAVALAGVKDGFAVLSVPVAPLLVPTVNVEWSGLAFAAGALLVGLLVAFLIHGEGAPQVPADLLAAAGRIERGDFGARVPTMAGKYGTVAAALNRAADAASHVAAAVASPDGTQQFFGRAPTHPDEGAPAPQAFELQPPAPPAVEPVPAAPPEPQAFSTTSRMDGSMFAGGLGQPQPAADAPLSEEQEEERHWEQTFDEFLRVREECGEASEGLTFDRFRSKLQKNKETLVQKYGCRTVRFQVYVKDGKAALKATPVK